VSFVPGVASVSGLSITIQIHWQHLEQKTRDEEKEKRERSSTNRQSRYTGNTGHKRHVTKKKRKQKGQAQIDNPDTLATPGTKDT
jgi:hypothetical protein